MVDTKEVKKSGRHDSNMRLLRPKRSALARLSYAPIVVNMSEQLIDDHLHNLATQRLFGPAGHADGESSDVFLQFPESATRKSIEFLIDHIFYGKHRPELPKLR